MWRRWWSHATFVQVFPDFWLSFDRLTSLFLSFDSWGVWKNYSNFQAFLKFSINLKFQKFNKKFKIAPKIILRTNQLKFPMNDILDYKFSILIRLNLTSFNKNNFSSYLARSHTNIYWTSIRMWIIIITHNIWKW